jgi:hypothetical protein
MAEVSGNPNTLTRVASGALPQYRFVRQIGNKDVLLAHSGMSILGVCAFPVSDNDHATVVYGGVTKIQLSQSLGAGIELVSDANGYAQNALGSGVGIVGSGTIAGLLILGATSGSVAEMIVQRH